MYFSTETHCPQIHGTRTPSGQWANQRSRGRGEKTLGGHDRRLRIEPDKQGDRVGQSPVEMPLRAVGHPKDDVRCVGARLGQVAYDHPKHLGTQRLDGLFESVVGHGPLHLYAVQGERDGCRLVGSYGDGDKQPPPRRVFEHQEERVTARLRPYSRGPYLHQLRRHIVNILIGASDRLRRSARRAGA